jgi:predicted ArsR family transcriptional regulator
VTTLRESQVETLDWLRLHGGCYGIQVKDFGPMLGITRQAIRRRLQRLEARNLVEPVQNVHPGSPPVNTYRLTNKGRSELSGRES